MLTDIFAYRYANVPLFNEMTEPLRRLLVQGFRILSEQIQPFYSQGKPCEKGKVCPPSAFNRQTGLVK